MERRLSAIFAADMVSYSRLIEADEVGTLERHKAYRREVIDPAFETGNGRIVKEMGDGVLVEFPSVVDAVQCAVTIQRAMDEREAMVSEERRIAYRVGINLGDIVVDGDDIHGDGVNVAARLEQLAEPGGICISGTAYDHMRSTVEAGYESLGEIKVKNIGRPIRVYKVLIDPDQAGKVIESTRSKLWFFAVASLALLASIAWFLWEWLGSSGPAETGATPKVAVLPLETHGDDADLRWLGDGLSDDIVTYLSRFRELRVLSRESSFRYSSGSPNHSAIRRDLGADFLVAGRVRINDDKVFLSLRLIETQDGTQVWSQKYERLYSELLSIREDMLQRVSAHLFSAARAEIGARVASHSPSSLKVYELVLRGWRAYYQFSRAATLDAEALADRAIAIDPDYSPAFVLRARLLTQFYVQPYDKRRGDEGVLENALAAAQRAVSLDPRSAEALAWLGHIHIWKGEYRQALKDIERAIAINPSSAAVWFIYADGLSRAGRQQDALNAWGRARRLDAVTLPLSDGLEARSHLLLGGFERAYELTSECLRRVPKLLPCHLFHIMAAGETGRDNEVQASAKVIKQVAPRFTVSGWRDIIKFADNNEANRMSNWLIKAGLAP